jgi:hypothetical protein
MRQLPDRIAVEDQRRRARIRQVDGHDRQVDELRPVALEVEVVDHLLREWEETARPYLVPASVQDLASARHAADVAVLLQDEHVQTATGENGCGGQAIVAGADHDHVAFRRVRHLLCPLVP